MAWDLESIERAFAEAALDPSRWNAAMEIVTTAVDSAGAALFPLRGRLPLMPHSPQMAEGFEVYVRDGWVERDERYRGVATLFRKRVATEFDFTTPDEMKRSPYYQEFLAPMKFRWFGGILVAAGENQWCLAVQRSIEHGPFSPSELKIFAGLSPRLSSVAAVAQALGFSAVSGAVEAFELSGTAVAQIDAGGHVIGLNSEAERRLGDGFNVVNKRLVAQTREATDALDRALHELLWNRRGSLLPPVLLPRIDKRALLAYPVSLASVAENPFADCRALVVLIDPTATNRPPDMLLRTAFKLTPAEAKLAVRIATGETIDDASDALGISKVTARHQLKAVFSKAGVHRQAQLVSLVSAMIGPFVGAT
jgi:DNA-binding CsgD family transcriptional regulator